MTLSDLIAEARTSLDDTVATFLWSDLDLLGYINYSINMLAEGAFLIYDDYTPAICGPIPIDVGDEYFTKDPRIIEVRELRLTPINVDQGPYQFPLMKRTREWLEGHFPTWPYALPGQPQIYCENMRIGAVRLIPVPEDACTAHMLVYRYPLADLSIDVLNASPEFETRFHKFIKHGVLSRAYLKQDNEAYDAKKAEEHRLLFEGSNDGRVKGDIQKAYRLKYNVELQVSETVGIHKAFAG